MSVCAMKDQNIKLRNLHHHGFYFFLHLFLFFFLAHSVGMKPDVSMEAKKVERLLRSQTSRDDEVLAVLSL